MDSIVQLFSGPHADHALRLIASIILGGLIGLERELRDKPAGFRTIILISVGATLFTILSLEIGAPRADPTRIAAQIVSGVGFLGAGAILRDRASVIGLTTAATIWAVAAVGMATGFGHLRLAAAGTIAILSALWLLNIFERWIGMRYDIQDYTVETADRDTTFEDIRSLFASQGLRTRKYRCHEQGTKIVFYVVALGSHRNHQQMQLNLVRSERFHLVRS
jgi:putative Mg2+ transporter-C (MgtC) family protein